MTTNNTLLLPDAFINSIKLNKFTAFHISSIFKLVKNHRITLDLHAHNIKHYNGLVRNLKPFTKGDNPIISHLELTEKELKCTFDKDATSIEKTSSTGKSYKKPYASYDLNVIEGLKRKKSYLLYVLVQKEMKMATKSTEKSTTITKRKVDNFTFIRPAGMEANVSDINEANDKYSLSYQYHKKEKTYTFTMTKLQPKETRSLAMQTLGESMKLEDISDLKLEKMFLEIATEIAKRSDTPTVNAVDMLNDLKQGNKVQPSNYAEAIKSIEKADNADQLIEKREKLSDLVSRIDRRLELKDSQMFALSKQPQRYEEWNAKRAFFEGQKALDIDKAVTALMDNESAVQLLEDIDTMLCNSEDDRQNKLSFGTVKAIMNLDNHTINDFETLENLSLIKIVKFNEKYVTFLVDGGKKHTKVSPLVKVLSKVHEATAPSITVVSGQLCF